MTSPSADVRETPWSRRLGVGGAVLALTLAAYAASGSLPARVQSLIGVVAFILIAVLFSSNIRRINPRVVGVGLALQVTIALVVTKIPVVHQALQAVGAFVQKFLTFTEGPTNTLFGQVQPFTPLALIILPTVVFVACVFTILFHLRIPQAVIRILAKGMLFLMGRHGASGAETLSSIANIFMGQTEAPLIVGPYVVKMTRSELLAVMVGGMSTIAGGVMAVYMQMGVEAVAILATSVMAAPCGLYVAKILVPETEEPVTRGQLRTTTESSYANVIDAAAGGASEGMKLAINIIAMLIAFMALIAMTNYFLDQVWEGLSLQRIFAVLFAPVAVLMGVDPADVPKVAELLGIKLVGNEFLAFEAMTKNYRPSMEGGMSPRSYTLATYALTGFANISSVGIQLGGIGSMPKDPAEQATLRSKLAKLGPKALLGGFLATLINSAVAGVIL